jgi:hypothetical protein
VFSSLSAHRERTSPARNNSGSRDFEAARFPLNTSLWAETGAENFGECAKKCNMVAAQPAQQ